MAKLSPEFRSASARYAALVARGCDEERIEQARQAVRALSDDEYIKDLLAGRYLSPAGIAKLAVLLHPEQAAS